MLQPRCDADPRNGLAIADSSVRQQHLSYLAESLTQLRRSVAAAERQLTDVRRSLETLAEFEQCQEPVLVDAPDLLTRQEAHVAVLAAAGKRNLEIAAALHISIHTVKSHLLHILDKTGLESRWQLRGALIGFSADPPTNVG